MSGTNKLKELAERAIEWGKNIGDQSWYPPEMFTKPYFSHSDADFLAATNPQTVLGLIADLEEARNGMEYQPIMRLKSELDRLKAENEALRKDAERYRWLRSLPRGNRHGGMTIMLAKDRPSPNQWCGDTIREEALDAAIDAALEGGGR